MVESPSAKLRVKLRMARAAHDPMMTLAEVARRIKRQDYTVRYWQMTGNIPTEALGPLCDALGVEMEYWRL